MSRDLRSKVRTRESSTNLLGLVWAAVIGVGAGSLVDARPPTFVLWLLVLISFGTVLRRPQGIRYAAVAALSFLAGLSGTQLAAPGPLDALASDVPHCELRGPITEHAGQMGTLVGAARLACDDRPVLLDAGVVILDELTDDPGTSLAVDGWLVPFSDESWDQARARTGADAAFDATNIDVVAEPRGVLGLAAAVRGSLRRSTKGLDERKAGLVRGLTIGDTSEIDEATEHQFRRTGLAHLVAVSGSNVAIVLGAVVTLIRRLRPMLRTILCLITLGLYVVIVGPEPSVLRAAAMGAIVVAGLVWGQRAEPLHALGLALVILIVVRPGLTTSVGLHLSAAATAGLVLWARPLAERLAHVLPRLVAWALGATLAAQIAVAPIMIVVFGEISLVAPLANLLAIPAVAPATVLGLAGAVIGLASPPLAAIAGRLAGDLAGWIVLVAETLARPPWAAVPCPSWVGWALAGPVAMGAMLTLRSQNRPAPEAEPAHAAGNESAAGRAI